MNQGTYMDFLLRKWNFCHQTALHSSFIKFRQLLFNQGPIFWVHNTKQMLPFWNECPIVQSHAASKEFVSPIRPKANGNDKFLHIWPIPANQSNSYTNSSNRYLPTYRWQNAHSYMTVEMKIPFRTQGTARWNGEYTKGRDIPQAGD